ncbi:dUTP diphosphatase [Bacteroidia bacterium]|jgi:dUTP pyrophosphatase|nr:dUTP diphosphatase [Bacteroidia bacterium]MDC0561536.1 dUTP diphosphatase [Bacteroidia bacterium]MDC3406737.1 dUTP diphosphatase [Bacteroidia bacterium]CAI8220312.1 MAG: Deoxyuridine 5'-triphosphate nucleotidohydrolase [Bacteroidia bacterium]
MINLPVINKSNNPLPEYQTKQSAGVDLCAFTSTDVILSPGDRVLIGTGLYIALPEGYEAQIRPRSGLALKHGITIINSPGTIDSDYRGELKIALINHSKEDYIVKNGDRIAQMVISKYEQISFTLTENLDHTERGEGGYGHTGI